MAQRSPAAGLTEDTLSRRPDRSTQPPATPSRHQPVIQLDADDNDDSDYLELLGAADFSSPSILARSSPAHAHPGVMPQTRRRTAAAAAAAAAAATAATASAAGISAGSPRPPSPTEASSSRTAAKRRRGEEMDSSSSSSSSSSNSSGSQGSQSSPGSQTGTSQNTASTSDASQSASTSSRPRISPKRPKRHETIVLDDDVFALDNDGGSSGGGGGSGGSGYYCPGSDGVEVIDLANVDRPAAKKAADDDADADEGAPPVPPAAPPPGLIKLAALQCVICMDDMSYLTVTHCGHLFCGECLHSSLNTNSARRICPICRTKIEMRGRGTSAAKLARSYFPLQLKVMSRTQHGKRPAPL